MSPEVTLVYGDPLPAGKLLEGVVVDDHLIMHIVSQRDMRSSSGKDRDAVEASHKSYESGGLVRDPAKSFGFAFENSNQAASEFTCWGTEINSGAGT
eukprot:933556-Karenia_brevis.AAC.1